MKLKVFTMIIAIILGAGLLAGCSSYSSSNNTQAPASSTTSSTNAPSASAASNQAVNIANFAFSPQTINIAKGTTVTWTNNDSTTHTVTSDTGVWNSGDLATGKTYSYTFNQTGTFGYHCTIHPYMKATVVVQ